MNRTTILHVFVAIILLAMFAGCAQPTPTGEEKVIKETVVVEKEIVVTATLAESPVPVQEQEAEPAGPPLETGGINLRRELEVAQALTDIDRLITLDSIWTRYLTEIDAATIPSEDIDELSAIVAEMDELLERISLEHLPLIVDHTVDKDMGHLPLRDIYSQQASSLAIMPEEQERVFAFLDEQPESDPDIFAVHERLLTLIPQEQDLLNEKIRKIQEGTWVPGDMSEAGRCWLGWAAVIGGAGGGIGPAVGAGILLIANYC